MRLSDKVFIHYQASLLIVDENDLVTPKKQAILIHSWGLSGWGELTGQLLIDES